MRWDRHLRILIGTIITILGLMTTSAADAYMTRRPGMPLCVAAVRPTDTVAGMLAHQDRFDCDTPQSQFGRGDFWAITLPLDMPPDHHLTVVRFASLWQNRVTVYAVYADGKISGVTMDGTAVSRKMQLNELVEHRFQDRSAPIIRIIWRVDGAANLRGIVTRATLGTPKTAAKADLRSAALYAGFAGLCLALLIYNFALWVALRHTFQIAYCVLIASLLVYAFSSSGVFAHVWPDIPNNDRIRLNYAMLAISGAAALLFARYFFETRVFDGWLGRASTMVVASLLGSGAMIAVLAPWHPTLLYQLFIGAFAAALAIVCAILWRAWRRRSDYLGLFAVGWAVPVAFASLRPAYNLHLIEWNIWIDNSMLAAMSLEALLSSVAIAYRIHLLGRDRDDTRVREVAAQFLADTDPLTGLRNRRSFLNAISTLEGNQRLLIADLDYFKQINETIGHDGGDDVLRAVARALRNACPPDALIARIGGEEFAIVIPVSTPLVPTSILDALRAEPMPFDLRVTASIGHCAGPLSTEVDWKNLYRRADKALFDAKSAGRDRARCMDDLSLVA